MVPEKCRWSLKNANLGICAHLTRIDSSSRRDAVLRFSIIWQQIPDATERRQLRWLATRGTTVLVDSGDSRVHEGTVGGRGPALPVLPVARQGSS